MPNNTQSANRAPSLLLTDPLHYFFRPVELTGQAKSGSLKPAALAGNRCSYTHIKTTPSTVVAREESLRPFCVASTPTTVGTLRQGIDMPRSATAGARGVHAATVRTPAGQSFRPCH
jgi:hypothetical protein